MISAKDRNRITDKLLEHYRSNALSAVRREQMLDCMCTIWDGYHPDNWVEDVAETRGEGCYPYTVQSLAWLVEIGIISKI